MHKECYFNVYEAPVSKIQKLGACWFSRKAAIDAVQISLDYYGLAPVYRIHVKFKSGIEIMNNDARKRNARLGRPLEMF